MKRLMGLLALVAALGACTTTTTATGTISYQYQNASLGSVFYIGPALVFEVDRTQTRMGFCANGGWGPASGVPSSVNAHVIGGQYCLKLDVASE